ncbi:MAG TPA: peptidase T [Bacteroidetes bacterium]|nr:peptidase T [Bacteroidota bacterium]
MSYNYTVKERFLRYVQIDTQSDPESNSTPSTEKQKKLAKVLFNELKEMGIKDVIMDEYGYIYASIPSNTDNPNIPKIFFAAHMDTAPDASGTDVKPILHINYQGEDIVLPDDESVVISPKEFPPLKDKIGQDIITASGKTLLGADDKAGVAAIMDAMNYLVQHPEIKHGKITALFTPDEEVGRGVEKVNMEKLDSDFGYTLDSGDLGHFEYENFSADSVSIKIKGVSAHPGYAKGKMENALKIASEIVSRLPKYHLTPEVTEGTQGFVHPVKIEGALEEASLLFIIRDFDSTKLKVYEDMLKSILDDVMVDYPNSVAEFNVAKQYRNMKDHLEKHPEIIEFAIQAIKDSGIKPVVGRIRGGTDGAMLSEMGMPTPNLFAGQYGIHSKKEWTSVQDMQKAVDVVINIIKLAANQ